VLLYICRIKDGSGAVSGRISTGFDFCGFGFGDNFHPRLLGSGSETYRFGFVFGFPPVDIQNKLLELNFIFYNILIITCLLRLSNLF